MILHNNAFYKIILNVTCIIYRNITLKKKEYLMTSQFIMYFVERKFSSHVQKCTIKIKHIKF